MHSILRKAEREVGTPFFSLSNTKTSPTTSIDRVFTMLHDREGRLATALERLLIDYFGLEGWLVRLVDRDKLLKGFRGEVQGCPSNTKSENDIIIDSMDTSQLLSIGDMAQGFTETLPRGTVVDISGATSFLNFTADTFSLVDAMVFFPDDLVYGIQDNYGVALIRGSVTKIRESAMIPLGDRIGLGNAVLMAQSLVDVGEDEKDIALAHTEVLSNILHHAGLKVSRGKMVLPRLLIEDSESKSYRGLVDSPSIISEKGSNTVYLGDLGATRVPLAAAPGIATLIHLSSLQQLTEEDRRLYKDTERVLFNTLRRSNLINSARG